MDANFTSFVCPKCHSEIEATLDMIGEHTECPACGAKIVIPDSREDNLQRHVAGDDDPDARQAMKSRTLRIELGDF